MSRDLTPAVKAAIEAPESVDALLAFLVVSHPVLPQPIRVVSDVLDYLVDGNLFTGMPFEFSLLSDGEGPAQTQLKVQNVDRRIGRAVLAINDRAQVTMEIRTSADFDLSEVPRVALPGGAPIYAFTNFELVDVTCTLTELTGRVMLRDYAQEPWPGLRCTQSRLPGLFR